MVVLPGSWPGWSDDGLLELDDAVAAAAAAVVVVGVAAATVELLLPGPLPSASRQSWPMGPERVVAYSCRLKEEDEAEEEKYPELTRSFFGAEAADVSFRFGFFRQKTDLDGFAEKMSISHPKQTLSSEMIFWMKDAVQLLIVHR